MYKFLWIVLISSICFSQASKEKAESFIAQKKYTKAQNEIQTFLDLNPEDKEAIELLGDAYGHQIWWSFRDESIKC